MGRTGRKPKLTPDLQKKIVDAIAAGNYNHVAAQYAGIGETSFYRWMAQGEEATSGIKREFWLAVKNAEAQAEVDHVALIETAAEDSWQASAWWLERKHNDRWGRKERQEHVGPGGGPVEVSFTQLTREMAAEDAAE